MFKLYETLAPARQLELAVRAKTPIQLAQTFAAYVGQFYDREAFDALARQVADLYDAAGTDGAGTFRWQLDRRLCERSRPPVTWDVAPARSDRVDRVDRAA
jgi:hypothetical protein